MYFNDSPNFTPHNPWSTPTPATTPSFSTIETEQLPPSALPPMNMSTNPPPRIGPDQLLHAVEFCRNNYANLAEENQYLRAQCHQQDLEIRALQNAYQSLRIQHAALVSESTPSSSLTPVEGMGDIDLQFDKSKDNALSGGKLICIHTFNHSSTSSSNSSSLPSSVVFSPCGEFLACAVGNSVEVRHCISGKAVSTYSGADIPPDASGINACGFSKNGKTLIAGGSTGIDIWNISYTADPRVKHHIPISGCSEIHSIDISAKNPGLFGSGSDDKIVHLWNSKNGKLMKSLGDHREENVAINALRFGDATSAHLATAADDGMARIWDVETGQLVQTLRGHAGCVADLDYSGDNRALVTGGMDSSVKVWDLRNNGKAALTFKQHSGAVKGVAYAPNHRWVISGAEDSTVVFWDLRLGRAAMQFRPHSGAVVDVAHNPSTSQFASTSKDRSTRLWSYGPMTN